MGKKLRKARERLNRRRLAHAATLKSLPSNTDPRSYKAPGSLKKKKC